MLLIPHVRETDNYSLRIIISAHISQSSTSSNDEEYLVSNDKSSFSCLQLLPNSLKRFNLDKVV